MYCLKKEYRFRLARLYYAIGVILRLDDSGLLKDSGLRGLYPALFSVFSFLWMKDSKSLVKKCQKIEFLHRYETEL